MDPKTESNLRGLVRQRIAKQGEEIAHSLRQIAAGNPLGAETHEPRLVARIAAKASMPLREAEAVATLVAQTARRIDGVVLQEPASEAMQGQVDAVPGRVALRRSAAEALQGPSIDFVGVEFLTRGRLAANAVGRVIFRSGRAQGSGFLVGPGLFLTNNHVIPSADAARQMAVEFDYENDDSGYQRRVTVFAFDPDACYVNDPTDGLDFALLAVGPRLSGDKPIDVFGFMPLSDAADKHMLGEIANIIQHPQGRLKQLVVRENNLVARDDTLQVLHYLGDTEKGSSGSPVCNNDWEPIALHHWGEPAFEVASILGQPLRTDVNEGIRISAIVTALRGRIGSMGRRSDDAVRSVLGIWDRSARSGPVGPHGEAAAGEPNSEVHATGSRPAMSQRVSSDGIVTWTLPLEISVRMPWAGAPALAEGTSQAAPPVPSAAPSPPAFVRQTAESAEDFSDRDGYEPGFIPGFIVPLPEVSNLRYRLARNRFAVHGEDPHELQYHHFSIVMNAERRLAAFTACNINGRRVVAVNRQTKQTNTAPTLEDLGVEALEGAEASDDFSPDPRILDSEQMVRPFYENQKVPGYEKPVFPGRDASEEERRAYHRAMAERTARMFQKGHIVLRGDPAWGTSDDALLAEEDTFFYTNAAPQLGFFNQGSPDDRPSAKGKFRWRAVESYILRNAVTMRKRVSVFAGPVFADSDPEYRFGVKVPMKFWKIAVWHGSEGLQSVALLADQSEVLKQLTKGVPEAAEAYDDEEELARVSEFLTTVEEIEVLTGLRFSDDVRAGDMHRGGERESAWDFDFQRLHR
ncbi:DNA/RNA non-specific endonuclease [Thauera sinica]|uniref:Serine protease n=1 Tax=Thauera sinica TaxID=2665146 RepID=A0ABW1AUC3_9RHOO|nr:DNA/RNA non-specific endonuclease [Thauera sp. K11]